MSAPLAIVAIVDGGLLQDVLSTDPERPVEWFCIDWDNVADGSEDDARAYVEHIRQVAEMLPVEDQRQILGSIPEWLR